MNRLLSVSLLLCLASCPPKPPVPPIPPTTAVLRVEVFKGDPAGDHKFPDVVVSLRTEANPTGPSGRTDGAGNIEFTLTFGDYDVWTAPDGYTRSEHHVELRQNQTVRLSVVETFVPLPRLVVRSRFFALETGGRFTVIQCSDFNLFARFQAGEDIEPVLHQRQEIGFNALRVWTLFNIPNIGTLLTPDYSQISAFLDLCARHGFYVEFTAYTSTFDPTHWPRLIASVRGKTNVLLELVNENDIPVNTIDTDVYARPTETLASHGSNGSQAEPVKPYWGYATFHTNGTFEEQRKVGHNAMEIWNGPTLTNETSRFPDVGMWSGSSSSRVQQLAFDAAAGAALLNAGSCFHSMSGKTSTLFSPAEIEAARAWVAGARSIDLDCQDGSYAHRLDQEGVNDLRVYERSTAGHNCIVRIRK